MSTSVLDQFNQAHIADNQVVRTLAEEKKKVRDGLIYLLGQCGVMGLGKWSDGGWSYVVDGVSFLYGVTNPPRGIGLILCKGNAQVIVHYSHGSITQSEIGAAILELEQPGV